MLTRCVHGQRCTILSLLGFSMVGNIDGQRTRAGRGHAGLRLSRWWVGLNRIGSTRRIGLRLDQQMPRMPQNKKGGMRQLKGPMTDRGGLRGLPRSAGSFGMGGLLVDERLEGTDELMVETMKTRTSGGCFRDGVVVSTEDGRWDAKMLRGHFNEWRGTYGVPCNYF
ncbi:hypothetical protein F4778DRAFT_650997 [Xylariomycetidae sp. FL2044]|nr:hypothetical protein F4778DRAFT_650997 [Xylariomycetidae sp. FL2044]